MTAYSRIQDVPSSSLEFQKVAFSYGTVNLLTGLSFRVTAGEIVGLVGPNGAGKSTALALASGILPVKSGKILLNECDVTNSSTWRRARLRLGRTYQDSVSIRDLSVLENVMIGSLFGATGWRSMSEARAIATTCLDRVGLADRANDSARVLSTGQHHLLDIARMLAAKPSVLLLDEPLATLSDVNRDRVLTILREERAHGSAIVLIEHVMKAVLAIADRIVVLAEGNVIAEGPPTSVLSDRRVVASYLGKAATRAENSEVKDEG